MNFEELVERDKGRDIKAELEQSIAEMHKSQHLMENMKIEINDVQPLGEVVRELERLGFFYNCGCDDVDSKMVTANNYFMQYDIYNHVTDWEINTTLAELKEM